MRRLIAGLAVVIVASACALARAEETPGDAPCEQEKGAVTATDAESAPKLIVPQAAIDAAKAGRYEEALPAYREALRQDPDNAERHDNLAWILVGAEHTDEAIRELREAKRLEPERAGFSRDLALVLAHTGRIEEAVDEFYLSIALDPNCSRTHFDLGRVYLQTGQFDEAVEQFSASLKIEDSADVRIARAFARCRDGQFDAAVEDCDLVLRDDPKDHGAYAIRAYSNARRGEFEAARRDAEQTLATGDEQDDVGYFVLGVLDCVQRDTESALENLNKAIDVDPNWPLPYVFRAMVHLQLHDRDATMKDLDAAIRVGNSPGELNYRLDGFGWQVYKFRGLARLNTRGTCDAAIDDLAQAVALNDQDPDCFALRGLAHSRRLDWEHAVEDFQRALDIDPKHYCALLWFTVVLTVCPDDSFRDGYRARELAERACELTGWQDAESVAMLAAAYSETGDFAEAICWQTQAYDLLRYPPPSDSDASAKRSKMTGIMIMWNSRYYFPDALDGVATRAMLKRYEQRSPFHLNASPPFGKDVTVKPTAIRR